MEEEDVVVDNELKEKDKYIAFQACIINKLKEKDKNNERKIENQRKEIKELNKKIEALKVKMDEDYAQNLEKDEFILQREDRLTKITRMLSESMHYIKTLELEIKKNNKNEC